MFGRYKALRDCETFEEADALREKLHEADIRAKVRDIHGVPGVQLLVEEDEFDQADQVLVSTASEEVIVREEEPTASDSLELEDTLPPEDTSLEIDTSLPELDSLKPGTFEVSEEEEEEETPRLASWDDLAIRAAEYDLEDTHPLGSHPTGDTWCELVRVEDPDTAEFIGAVLTDRSVRYGVTGPSASGSLPGVALTKQSEEEENVVYVGERDLEYAQAILDQLDAVEEAEEEEESEDDIQESVEVEEVMGEAEIDNTVADPEPELVQCAIESRGDTWCFLAAVHSDDAAHSLATALNDHGIPARMSGPAILSVTDAQEPHGVEYNEPSTFYVAAEDLENAQKVINLLILGAQHSYTYNQDAFDTEVAQTQRRKVEFCLVRKEDEAEFYRDSLAEHDIKAEIALNQDGRYAILIPESRLVQALDIMDEEIDRDAKVAAPKTSRQADKADFEPRYSIPYAEVKSGKRSRKTNLPPLKGIPYARPSLSPRASKALEEIKAEHTRRKQPPQRKRAERLSDSGATPLVCPKCGSPRIHKSGPSLNPALVIIAVLIMFFLFPIFGCAIVIVLPIALFLFFKAAVEHNNKKVYTCISCSHRWS